MQSDYKTLFSEVLPALFYVPVLPYDSMIATGRLNAADRVSRKISLTADEKNFALEAEDEAILPYGKAGNDQSRKINTPAAHRRLMDCLPDF